MGGQKSTSDLEVSKTPHWRLVIDQAVVTPEVQNFPYTGSGTCDDPYVITWIPNDPRNPMLFSPVKKWMLTALVSVSTLAVAFVSSAYSGGAAQVMEQFHVGSEVATLGVSLFVLGFAIGPLIWAPLSEVFGRQILFVVTYGCLTAFNAGAAGSQNIQTLLILRFFAGAFGSSPLTNAGGAIADMFDPSHRGLAMTLFAAAPFLGPTLGPVIGGFLGMNEGWKWVEGFLAIFSGALWLVGAALLPETYAPVLLRKRAERLAKMTGKVYRSKLDADRPRSSLKEMFGAALLRPWILLFREPIVLILSIYMAIIYGTLYMLFPAFPIVFQEVRGWNQGIGGLAFLGVTVGMMFAVAAALWDNKRYIRVVQKHQGFAPPESRLPLCLVGGLALPVSLFWFAWTNYPSIHWIVSIIATVPFGFGVVTVFLTVVNYLVDSYTIFAASVLAANAVLRSLFGMAFPLFTTYMYHNLGIHWASTIPAFLALACTPFPFLFYKYGSAIRLKCKFAALSDDFMRKLREAPQQRAEQTDESMGDTEDINEKATPPEASKVTSDRRQSMASTVYNEESA
ncbi:hypothetical protein VTN96DRAFT_5599 [Rasamsonia emersonii]